MIPALKDGTVRDLIRRLEDAMEPDRGLDREVLWEVFAEERKQLVDGQRYISTTTARDGEFWFTPLSDRHDCPRYTGSLDDAMDLLGPPGYPLWTVTLNGRSHGSRGGITWTAEVTVPSSEFQGWSQCNGAIAVCVAALRARIPR